MNKAWKLVATVCTLACIFAYFYMPTNGSFFLIQLLVACYSWYNVGKK